MFVHLEALCLLEHIFPIATCISWILSARATVKRRDDEDGSMDWKVLLFLYSSSSTTPLPCTEGGNCAGTVEGGSGVSTDLAYLLRCSPMGEIFNYRNCLSSQVEGSARLALQVSSVGIASCVCSLCICFASYHASPLCIY